jgi:hypothetical protein
MVCFLSEAAVKDYQMPKKINQTKQQHNTPDTPRKTAKRWVEESA